MSRTGKAALTIAAIAVIGFGVSAAAQLVSPAPAQPTSSTPGQSATVPAEKPSIVRGRVLAADSGTPLRRAQVRVVKPGTTVATMVTATDEQGQYEFSDLAPGRYTLSAEKAGYIKWSYGQRASQDGADPIEVISGQALERVDIALPRSASISVRVTDDFGQPFARATVKLERFRFVTGLARLQAAATGESDETGFVRLSELPPGEYYVSASPLSLLLRPSVLSIGSNDSSRILAPTYYPSAIKINEATKVRLTPGADLDVDVRLMPVQTVSVSGIARTREGEPLVGTLQLIPERFGSAEAGDVTSVQSDGSFTFAHVIPGRYLLRSAAVPGTPRQYVYEFVDVTGDASGLMVTTTNGVTLRGRLAFDTGAPPADVPLSNFVLYADPAWQTAQNLGAFTAHDDGTFELAHAFGRTVLRLRTAPTTRWFLKSVILDGKDITDTITDFTKKDIEGLVVTFTQKRTEVIGSVRDSRGEPVREYVAVVFTEDRERWTPQSRAIAAGRADRQGAFTITGLPPGRYLAAAVDTLEPTAEHDPELLDRLVSSAVPLTLQEGESKTIALRMGR